jgi:hypothetical protein
MTLFPSMALAVACAALIWALGAFDRLIEIGSAELDDRRIAGRRLVIGEVRDAPESFFQNGLARNRLFVRWLFQTPKWASEHRIARRLFRCLRVGSAIAFAGFVLFVAGAFLGT